MEPTDLALDADPGVTLAATVFAPDGPATVAVVVSSGTGFRRRTYRHLAAWLCERGALVVTYDFRGIGDSATDALLQEADLPDWGRDLDAVLAWVAEAHPDLPVVHLGHSAGGHIVGFSRRARRVRRHLFVAVGAGTLWQHFVRRWPLELWFWWGLGAWNLARWGSLRPGGGWTGTALPGPVFRTWRRWSHRSRYHADEVARFDAEHVLPAMPPITSWVFTDDGIATPRSARTVLDAFPGATSRLEVVAPHEVGLRSIGHGGAFRDAEALWERWWSEVVRPTEVSRGDAEPPWARRWRQAGFAPVDGAWRRGHLRLDRSERGWVLQGPMPADVRLGVPGGTAVADGVALQVATDDRLLRCDDQALRCARVLDHHGARIDDGRLEVPVPEGDGLEGLAAAAEGLRERLEAPLADATVRAMALQGGARARAAVRHLAEVDPEALAVVRARGAADAAALAAQLSGDLPTLVAHLDALAPDPGRYDAARDALLAAIAPLPDEDARALVQPSDHARLELALARQRWEELPPRTWLATHAAARRRVFQALRAHGQVERALAESLELDPTWAEGLVGTTPDAASLRRLRHVADDPHANPAALPVVAALLAAWGEAVDVARLRGLPLDDPAPYVARLQDRLGGAQGALSLAGSTGGEVSVVDPLTRR